MAARSALKRFYTLTCTCALLLLLSFITSTAAPFNAAQKSQSNLDDLPGNVLGTLCDQAGRSMALRLRQVSRHFRCVELCTPEQMNKLRDLVHLTAIIWKRHRGDSLRVALSIIDIDQDDLMTMLDLLCHYQDLIGDAKAHDLSLAHVVMARIQATMIGNAAAAKMLTEEAQKIAQTPWHEIDLQLYLPLSWATSVVIISEQALPFRRPDLDDVERLFEALHPGDSLGGIDPLATYFLNQSKNIAGTPDVPEGTIRQAMMHLATMYGLSEKRLSNVVRQIYASANIAPERASKSLHFLWKTIGKLGLFKFANFSYEMVSTCPEFRSFRDDYLPPSAFFYLVTAMMAGHLDKISFEQVLHFCFDGQGRRWNGSPWASLLMNFLQSSMSPDFVYSNEDGSDSAAAQAFRIMPRVFLDDWAHMAAVNGRIEWLQRILSHDIWKGWQPHHSLRDYLRRGYNVDMPRSYIFMAWSTKLEDCRKLVPLVTMHQLRQHGDPLWTAFSMIYPGEDLAVHTDPI